MIIEKHGDKIVFTLDAKQKRMNPYDEEGNYGYYPTLTGIIEPTRNGVECGFAYTIDMDYKDKPDQWTEVVIKFYGTEEEFEKKCAELGVEIVKYRQCARCKKASGGTFCGSKKIEEEFGGSICYSCELDVGI